MALRWDWNKKVGMSYLTQNEKTWEMNLYRGNALLIEIYEWIDEDGKEKYQLCNFFCDTDHLKNCVKDELDYSDYEYRFYKDMWNEKDLDKLISGLTKMGAKCSIIKRV